MEMMDGINNNNNYDKQPIHILITAGGTSEKIDDVRRITNSGTGRLGALTAEAFAASGQPVRITYLCSASAVRPRIASTRVMGQALDPDGVSLNVVHADDVSELQEAVARLGTERSFDIIVHSMAVGDYRVRAVSDAEQVAGEAVKRLSYLTCGDSSSPEEAIAGALLEPPLIRESKISSDKENLVVVLEKSPKIIGMLRGLAPKAVIVGFKLLSEVDEEELLRVGLGLLQKNDCDFVLANDMRTVRSNRQEGLLISADGSFERGYGKSGIADLIVMRTIAALSFSRRMTVNGAE
ncbi:phosphopantothenate--cysteine ligase [Clostridia bacterium]|nr:phosphopantothenate--cysteine ligase [Clostridia bacterium]